MPRYTDGKAWYDCTQFEGLLFTVTADGSVATVDIHPTVKVTVFETENFYDPRTDTMKHFFDMFKEDDTLIVVKMSVSGQHIKKIVRFL